MPASVAAPGRAEIDFSVFNPYDPEWVRDPFPVINRLLNESPVAYHRDLRVWLVTSHELIMEVLRSERFSTRIEDWNEWNPGPSRPDLLYDRVPRLSNLDPVTHQKVRRLTAPAFSRRVMDMIERRIRTSIAAAFDAIPDPRRFDAASTLAETIPIRAISSLVGVPTDAGEAILQNLAWHTVRAGNPMYASDRESHLENTQEGLEYLLGLIQERRSRPDPGDDFIGTLVGTAIDGESLDDFEILSVINALLVAGADTAVDLHTFAIYGLLLYPEQWELLRHNPELSESATIEILRWAAQNKIGAIPRFPRRDTELGGQVLEKGSYVMTLLSGALSDPSKWDDPRRLDITRDHGGHTVFGAGPHMCIGLNLVKAQNRVMLDEWNRRFGDTARLVSEPTYDATHFNARRIVTLMVETAS